MTDQYFNRIMIATPQQSYYSTAISDGTWYSVQIKTSGTGTANISVKRRSDQTSLLDLTGVPFTIANFSYLGVGYYGPPDYGYEWSPMRVANFLISHNAAPLTGVQKLAAGFWHTCALATGGGLKCWGDNEDGQLGDNSAVSRLSPVDVAGLSGVTEVAAGGFHTCALLSNGGVKCWGDNAYGQLGDNSTTDRRTPVDVAGLTGVTAITAGIYHSCALLNSGGVKCWGRNNYGQLGDNTTTNRPVPTDVPALTGVSSVVGGGGGWHSCALLSGGAVKCWGRNNYGQLGDGSTTNRSAPVGVSGLSGATAIAGGGVHSCALLSGGGVKCWGHNGDGQLGDASTTGRQTPVNVVGLASVTAIGSGEYHSCALLSTGGVKCWGDNSEGQLGDNSTINRLTPVSVSGLTSVTAIAVGADHGCSLVSGGAAKCWGYNAYGQLGNGSLVRSLIPVDVLGGDGTTPPPPPAPTPMPAWEFFNTQLNHYFITAGAGEAQAIDSGSAGGGWVRTGLTFDVYALGGNTGVPVCRFYGTPGRGPNSHFYTADADECEQVKADPGWTYEGLVFNTVRPSNGSCPSGLLPVYRAYNGRWAQNDSNHRYTANSTAYEQTVLSGWNAEGAVMCTPNAAGTPTLDTGAATVSSDDPNPTEISTGTGARVRIPAGALPRNPDGSARTVVVTLTKDPTSDPNPLPGHTRGSDLYALTPDGERLQSNLSVTLPMRPGGTRNGLTMMRFNSDGTVDDLGGQYDSAADAVTAASDRFAKFAVGVRSANPVNGVCGSANGTAVSSAPTSNLCAAGTATGVTGSGPWYWSCLGNNGGANASCSAPVASSAGRINVVGEWDYFAEAPGLCPGKSMAGKEYLSYNGSSYSERTEGTFVNPYSCSVSFRACSEVAGYYGNPISVDEFLDGLNSGCWNLSELGAWQTVTQFSANAIDVQGTIIGKAIRAQFRR
ncbi:MAG: hypothetical protein F9K47_12855 [Burkholderiales bacterium]|nr:MAG: hypothetical protein F9K47_12855 [Burkholderiales bacterium]